MNKTRKIIIGLSIACSAAFALAGCATLDMTIPDLIDNGYDVMIEFDQNGGVVASSSKGNIFLKDLYSSEQLEAGIKLLAPGDEKRGIDVKPMSEVSRAGYFLIGWYQNKEPRVDENNNPLDDNGELCSVTGKAQGWSYSGFWNFDTDRVTADLTHEETLNENLGSRKVQKFTLYAAWSPDYTYAFYHQETVDGATNWVQYGSSTLPKNADGTNAEGIAVPSFSDEKGKLEYGEVKALNNFTMAGLYADEALSEPYAEYAADTSQNRYEELIPHAGPNYLDLETGTATNTIVNVYTTWHDGLIYRVTSARNFADNMVDSAGTGHFIFKNDIDFTPVKDETTGAVVQQVAWTANLMDFSGVIEGNGYTVKGITTTQASYDNSVAGGVFGALTANAKITDLAFEDVTFTINTATSKERGLFGLLAGSVDGGATLEGVTITGELHLGNLYPENGFENYTIGLICGDMAENAAVAEIDRSGITVVVDKLSYIDSVTFEYYTDGAWAVTFTVNADGTLKLARNEDPKNFDPNL